MVQFYEFNWYIYIYIYIYILFLTRVNFLDHGIFLWITNLNYNLGPSANLYNLFIKGINDINCFNFQRESPVAKNHFANNSIDIISCSESIIHYIVALKLMTSTLMIFFSTTLRRDYMSKKR